MNIEVYNSESFKMIANSIREQANTENKLSFPYGFLKNIRKCNDSLAKRFTLESYSNEKVTKIPKYAFYYGNIKTIDCPNVTEIGEYAFYETKMENINLPKIKKISENAFKNCNIKELNLPEVEELELNSFYNNPIETAYLPKVKYMRNKALGECKLATIELPLLEEMGSLIFGGDGRNGPLYCTISSLDLPNVRILDRSFEFMSSLTSINCPKLEETGWGTFRGTSLVYFDGPSVKTLGQRSFNNCEQLIEVNLPEVVSIGDTWGGTGGNYYGFASCYELLKVNAPKLEASGQYNFRYCSKLEEANFPLLKGSPGSGIFHGCTSLKYVNLPEIESIPYITIDGSTLLRELSFPKVRDCLDGGIRNCSVLKKIELDVVNNIQKNAFYNCQNFDTLIIRRTDIVPVLENISAFYNSKIAKGTGLIYVADNLIEEYKTATNWSTFVNQIKPISEYILCTDISMDSSLNITNNSPQILTATLIPSNTVEELKWESSDMSVAYVLSDGTVIPKKNGTTIITASCGQAKANCTVTVSNMNNITHTDTLFQLSEGLALNGQEYINTNVQLAKEDIDFTIVGDITLKDGNGQYKTIYHCLEYKDNSYAGFMMDVDGADQIRFHTHGTNTILPIPNKIQVSNFKFVVTHLANSQQIKIKYLHNSKITEKVVNINYKSTLNNLYIGARLGSNGVLGRHPKGAIHDFAIMNRVLTAEEINDYLS